MEQGELAQRILKQTGYFFPQNMTERQIYIKLIEVIQLKQIVKIWNEGIFIFCPVV